MPMEILAPAGSMESLTAAVRCGANAVYLGGKNLNARRTAANFDETQLREAVSYCHVRGVKVFLTLNTVIFDRELVEAREAVRQACEAGVDAVIVQDLAVARLVRELAPDLELHASTQMSVHNAEGVRMLEKLGFRRVVLARELSEEEIRRIHKETAVELEVFVHGALCMCVSGQCYLSSMIGGRSGNRGLCAQPCRLPFRNGSREYALSLKDLSLIAQIKNLADIGVKAFKIEGRMKRPEYVATAVDACRRAMAGEPVDFHALEAVFSRSGFTDGYFGDQRGHTMFGTRQKEDVVSAAGVLKNLEKLYQKERQLVPVEMELTVHRGQGISLTASDPDGNRVSRIGEPPQEARTAPTTAEKAANSLQKTGGTPYTICNIQSKIDDGLMVPASELNRLRREALDGLTAIRGEIRPIAYSGELPTLQEHAQPSRQELRIRLHRLEQFSQTLLEQADRISLPVQELMRIDRDLLRNHAEKWMAELPSMAFNNQEKLVENLQHVKDCGVGHAVAGNLGSIRLAQQCGFVVHGDYSLNITNSYALEEYHRLGLESLTLSMELEQSAIGALKGEVRRGILAWGYLPLMTTRNCPVDSCNNCDGTFPELEDRKGNRFFVDCDGQASRMYNCVPLFLADRLQEWRRVDFLTLYFTKESPKECMEVLALYRDGGQWTAPKTRGLYYRKVL